MALNYFPGTIATGADLTITIEDSGVAVLTKADAGTSNVSYYPRAPNTEVADGSAGSAVELIPVVDDRLKVVVAQGGDTKTGEIELIYHADTN